MMIFKYFSDIYSRLRKDAIDSLVHKYINNSLAFHGGRSYEENVLSWIGVCGFLAFFIFLIFWAIVLPLHV